MAKLKVIDQRLLLRLYVDKCENYNKALARVKEIANQYGFASHEYAVAHSACEYERGQVEGMATSLRALDVSYEEEWSDDNFCVNIWLVTRWGRENIMLDSLGAA